MRQLQTNDIFRMSRIFKKLSIKAADVEMETAEGKTPDNADEKLALAVILKVVENLHLAQAEINDFLGDLVGITGEEFGVLPISETIQYIKEFKELDGIADFFARVGQWTKSL
ncbi:hypothetical protein [Papillibacter cinnamivorans]|uniref:Uncharacterized protein n=1 Tax=Papillibacter cinnamivorans DSM 12816 TaxID=1122930 RepID=A0A1W1YT58_9FIRM|nr:hypothetical protein [Papillibacter cinnamivorans]SMC39397.1 hypothetical protein SAMN02745168_0641 [Papillibacter cinnamivorans DSM 12816]